MFALMYIDTTTYDKQKEYCYLVNPINTKLLIHSKVENYISK